MQKLELQKGDLIEEEIVFLTSGVFVSEAAFDPKWQNDLKDIH